MERQPERFVILDGAMGTMLQARGLRAGEISELMSLNSPGAVAEVHRAYAEAGSQVLYANTFGANRRRLAGTGHSVAEVIGQSVRIAREAAGSAAIIALDVGPLGALLEPLGTLKFEEAVSLFAEMMDAGVAAGADLVVIETMTDLQEARAALIAAKERTALPVWVTMSFEKNGRTFTGCTIPSMAHTLEGLGADAIGINCSVGPAEALSMLRELRGHTRLPLIVKPNAGLPDPLDGSYSLSPADFASAMREIAAEGAVMLGGCCGTTPAHIAALREAIGDLRPDTGSRTVPPMICTPTMPVSIDRVRIVGERVNPTGKKRFQQALLENDLDYIVDVAVQQQEAGADILDVNVGFPGVDEAEMLPRVIRAIQEAVELPLQLDSTNPQALEAGLRVYCGKASVNSVNGDRAVLDRILPIVKKYGASVVGLTLDDKGLPSTAGERVAIAERILDAALAAGIPREDVWIDCLTLTVSAQQEQARETLSAVREVTERLGLKTLLGVSNISFGLPNRPLITSAFLAQALSAGLTLPIVNPNQREIMDIIAASRVLNGEDARSEGYIARFAGVTAAPAAAPSTAGLSLEAAIVKGLRGEAARLAREALQTQGEMQVVEERLIPALDQVGTDYEQGRAYLPQLLSAAQAAQAVFEEIRRSLADKGEKRISRGKIVMATVKGDVHDIGKNIVRTVLENYGYEVTDLGRDVPAEVIARTARETGAPLVGLSALMTTTLPAMAETVALLKTLDNPPSIMVGGAVVTAEYAASIGADAYCRDARAAVAFANEAIRKG